MHKIGFLLLICIILVACKENAPTRIENAIVEEQEEISEEKLGLWYEGYFGEEPFKIQWHDVDARFVGKMIVKDKTYIITGENQDEFYFFNSDLGNLYLHVNQEAFFGCIKVDDKIIPLQGTKDHLNHKYKTYSEQLNALSGEYLNEGSDYYQGVKLNMTPLYDKVLFVEAISYDGLYEKVYSWLAYEENNFIGYYEGKKLTLTYDHYQWLLEAEDSTLDRQLHVVEDGFYSNSITVEPHTLENIWSEKLLTGIKNILGDNFEKLKESAQHITPGEITQLGVTGDLNRVLTYWEEGCLYVYLSKTLFDDEKSRLYTNNLNALSTTVMRWSPDVVVRVPVMSIPEKVVTTIESVNELTEVLALNSQRFGYLDKDTFEDLSVLMSYEEKQFLLVFIGNGSSFDLIYVNEHINDEKLKVNQINIEENHLILYYEDISQRTTYKYYFDATSDYLLDQVIISTHSKDGSDVRILTYDMKNDDVTLNDNGNSTTYYKTLHDHITLQTFDIEVGIHEDYR
ncbi:MAG: hypothetical protein JXR88_01360 [Clostridia bacterium]|nr:hypothetical protein [Clostridia bacterium]